MSVTKTCKTKITDSNILANVLEKMFNVSKSKMKFAGDKPLVGNMYGGQKITDAIMVIKHEDIPNFRYGDVVIQRHSDGTLTIAVDDTDIRHSGFEDEEVFNKEVGVQYGKEMQEKAARKIGAIATSDWKPRSQGGYAKVFEIDESMLQQIQTQQVKRTRVF